MEVEEFLDSALASEPSKQLNKSVSFISSEMITNLGTAIN
jgi:hypothetical protein